MFTKKSLAFVGVTLSLAFTIPYAYAQTTTTTTTLEQQTTTSEVKVVPRKRVRRVVKRRTTPAPAVVVQPVEATTTIQSTTTTTTPPPPRMVARKPYTEGELKKLGDSLCTKGYKSYVGTVEKNVCNPQAKSPDIAYTCVWDEKGPQVYPQNTQGPCSLDFAEHKGNVVIQKDKFPDPPLAFGTEAQCCVRAASGPEVPPVVK